MKDSELENLFKMINFSLSKKEDYWENHPEEVYSDLYRTTTYYR